MLEPPLGLDGKLKTARKGLGRFTITVHGVAAHAGLDPGKGANAIVELSHQVQQLYAMNNFESGITVNIGMIQGGVSSSYSFKPVLAVRIFFNSLVVLESMRFNAFTLHSSSTMVTPARVLVETPVTISGTISKAAIIPYTA